MECWLTLDGHPQDWPSSSSPSSGRGRSIDNHQRDLPAIQAWVIRAGGSGASASAAYLPFHAAGAGHSGSKHRINAASLGTSLPLALRNHKWIRTAPRFAFRATTTTHWSNSLIDATDPNSPRCSADILRHTRFRPDFPETFVRFSHHLGDVLLARHRATIPYRCGGLLD